MFISHAAPEDNAFTLWLGAKLAAMGYEVWADVLRLRGGDDKTHGTGDLAHGKGKRTDTSRWRGGGVRFCDQIRENRTEEGTVRLGAG